RRPDLFAARPVQRSRNHRDALPAARSVDSLQDAAPWRIFHEAERLDVAAFPSAPARHSAHLVFLLANRFCRLDIREYPRAFSFAAPASLERAARNVANQAPRQFLEGFA